MNDEFDHFLYLHWSHFSLLMIFSFDPESEAHSEVLYEYELCGLTTEHPSANPSLL